jgi:biofilm PGA synthesis N-glycosyltransferase PgaC
MLAIIGILGILTVLVFVFVYLDKNKKRHANINVPLSFIIPCYNDAASIKETIESIYSSCSQSFELIVVDDKSTDESLKILKRLKNKYKFILLQNKINLGKSKTLNKTVEHAKNEIIVFVDADLLVNKQALDNALLRLLSNSKIGAVSCPYKPKNKGLLALMQSIEYNMTAFIKGSYNLFSAITLWGGFVVLRKNAFIKAGKFSINAITEDIDLAYKLNRCGFKVEQSFIKVFTYVPTTLKDWFKQKVRWSSGAIEANLRYKEIWFKNPIHMMFFLSYTYITFYSFYSFFTNIPYLDNMYNSLYFLIEIMRFTIAMKFMWMIYGTSILNQLLIKLLFAVFLLPYSITSNLSFNNFLKILIIIPFSMAYMPIYILISIIGIFIALYKIFYLKKEVRAW